MPQGKVIAVKPSFTGGGVELRSLSTTETTSYGSSSAGGEEQEGRIIFIGVMKGKSRYYNSNKVKSVVWYEDTAGRFEVGDFVEFKINNQRTKAISAAKNVVRRKGKVIGFPGNMVSKIALLASLLLIFGVVRDTRR